MGPNGIPLDGDRAVPDELAVIIVSEVACFSLRRGNLKAEQWRKRSSRRAPEWKGSATLLATNRQPDRQRGAEGNQAHCAPREPDVHRFNSSRYASAHASPAHGESLDDATPEKKLRPDHEKHGDKPRPLCRPRCAPRDTVSGQGSGPRQAEFHVFISVPRQV